jgi:hypothetical protein
MSSATPKGWEKDSDKLFIHNSGVRIQLMTYRQKEGWYLVPTDLDQPVVEFEPTPEGRQKAFEAFAAGVLDSKPKRKKSEASEAAAKKKKKPVVKSEEESEEEEGGEKESKEKEAEKDADDDDDEEEEEEGDDDEG